MIWNNRWEQYLQMTGSCRDRRVMNQLLNKLERKYGKYAVPDLIKYVIVLYCAGAALGLIDNRIYYNYLSLNVEAILHGQVWRLVTYLIEPYGFNTGMGFIVSILFFAIQVNLFFLFGRSLERAWGTFRFNMYFISGWLLNIVACKSSGECRIACYLIFLAADG